MHAPPLVLLATVIIALSSTSQAHPALRKVDQDDSVDGAIKEVNATTNACVLSSGLDDAGTFSPPLYNEPYRPQLHYSPSTGYANDPNGLHKRGDTWFMYYQYNPFGTTADRQHWGVTTSKDLYTWHNHAPAIKPGNGAEFIFSGSAVVDRNNTSGFFDASTPPDKRTVAVYTLDTALEQTQNLAYSSDGLRFTKYDGNPVLSSNSTQFRDPKVWFEEKGKQWVMAVAHSQDYQVGFYASSNLREWRELSRFGPAGNLALQFECPTLEQVRIVGGPKHGQTAHVLVLSVNPGGPNGGSATQAFIGDWDGTSFKPWTQSVQMMDFAQDFYAAQSFYDAPGVMIGWASNWMYAEEVPTSPWRGVMTLPRLMTVQWTALNGLTDGYQVAMQPYGLDRLKRHNLVSGLPIMQPVLAKDGGESGNMTTHVALNGTGAFDIHAVFALSPTESDAARPPRAELRILTANAGEHLAIGVLFSVPATIVYVDRRFAGRAWSDNVPTFTDRFNHPVTLQHRVPNDPTSDLIVRLHLVVDRTLSELFVQDGVASATVLHYWDNQAVPNALSVTLNDGQVQLDSLSVDAIDPTMPRCI